MKPTSFDEFQVTIGDLIRGGLATKGLNQLQAAKALKLDVGLLEMIEAGEHLAPYPEHLMNAIVRDYAVFLGLDPLEIRSLYWTEVVEKTLQKESGSKTGDADNDHGGFSALLKKFFASWA
jgi:cytoskeletal protein RodZ